MSMFTLVTGRKLPLKARIFFLYKIAAGSMFFPLDQTHVSHSIFLLIVNSSIDCLHPQSEAQKN
jgi:hypothetical protein